MSLLLSTGCPTGASAGAPSVTLASEGKALYSIAICADASKTEKFAAEELRDYLQKISHASFELLDHPTQHSILVGTREKLNKIVRGLQLDDLDTEEFGILARGNNICLTGGSGRAVLYAVYDFLTALGCRWVAPSFEFYEGNFDSIPQDSTLLYSPLDNKVEGPAFKYRKLYIEEGRSYSTSNLLQLIDWMPHARFNTLVCPINYEGHDKVEWDNWRDRLTPELKKRQVLIEVGGHGYQNFINAKMDDGSLFKEHPDWFGRDQQGHRSADPHQVFCTSNPEAVAYLENNILAYLKSHPEIDIFDFWPPDSERWCSCPACLALGDDSDRHALLVSQVARFLKTRLPAIRLECIAYSHYTTPPQNEKLDRDILLDFCPINQSFEFAIDDDGSPENQIYHRAFQAWRRTFDGDISIYSYYRKYAWRSLPVILPHYLQRDLRYYRGAGAQGISVYSEPGDWFTYGVNHFVLGNLAWNPNLSVDSLVRQYCDIVYGSSAALAVKTYKVFEEVVPHACSIPHTAFKSQDAYKGFEDRLKKMSQELNDAEKEITDRTVGDHLDRLSWMVGYASQNVKFMAAKARGASADTLAILARGLDSLVDRHSHAGIFVSLKAGWNQKPAVMKNEHLINGPDPVNRFLCIEDRSGELILIAST